MHPLVPQMLASARASGSSGWLRANCLACLDRAGKLDTKASFRMSTSSGFYECMRCGLRGFVDGDYDRYVPERVLSASERQAEEEARECREWPGGFYLLEQEPALSSRTAQPARAFLDRRGIDARKRAQARIGACLLPGHRFYGRIIAPLFGSDGSLCGYVGRSWEKRHPLPYLYPKGMRRGAILHGAHLLHRKTDEPIVVVEGYFDALYLSDGGDAVPVLGMPSEDQMTLMLEAERPVVFCLDGDAWLTGYALAQRLNAAAIAQALPARFGALRLPPGCDPDELSPQDVFSAARDAVRT